MCVFYYFFIPDFLIDLFFAILSQELSRPVGVLSSSEYGRRQPPLSYKPGRQFARVAHIRSEFYRKNGISKSAEDGYGSVVPVWAKDSKQHILIAGLTVFIVMITCNWYKYKYCS